MAFGDRVVNFVVKITGDTRDLARDLSKTEKDVAAGQSRLQTAIGRTGSFLAANWQAGAAAAGAAVTAFVANSIAGFREQAVEARNVAASTGLAVDEASKYLAVLRKMGVEASAGDLADVVLNINQQSKAVEDLGIKADSSGERLTKLIDYIAGISDETERARLASKFFGEEGSRQFGVLIDSGGRYKEIMDGLRDGEFINAEEAEKAREFDAAMQELNATVRDLQQNVAESLVPALSRMAADVERLRSGVIGLPMELPGWLQKGMFESTLRNAPLVGPFIGLVRNLQEAWDDTSESVGKVGDGMGKAQRGVNDLTESMTEQWEAAAAGRDELSRLGRAYQDYTRNLQALDAWLERYRGTVQKTAKDERDLTDAIREKNDAILAGIDAEFAAKDAQRQLAEATQASWDAFQAWQNAPAVAQRISEVEAEIAKIQAEDRPSTNDQRRLEELQAELSRLKSTPTGSQADFEAAFQAEQQAILRAAASAGQLAGFWGADSAGQVQAQIDELARIRGQVPAQSDFIDRMISMLQRSMTTGATGGGAVPGAFTGPGGIKGALSGGMTVNIITGADPGAVQTALASIASAGGNTWGIR